MRRLRELILRFGGLFNKQRKDLELDEEIESHLQLHIEDNLRLGMTPEEARREALIKLGGIESAKEAYRDQRGLPLLETLWQDIRYGARMLRKNPGFTAVAMLTLAFAIGANTTIFTVINSVLLRSLPVRDPDELVQIVSRSESGRADYAFSYPFYEQLRDGGRSLSGLFAAGGVGLKDRLLVPGEANAVNEFVRAQPVSGNFFSVLGVSPVLGRTLMPEDDKRGSPQAAAVISHNFWQRRFGGDPSVVGRAVSFYNLPFTIVGVTPPGFFGFQPGENPDLWWPLQMAPQIDRDPSAGRFHAGTSWLRLVGRLSNGVERKQAEAELGVIGTQYQQEFAASRAAKWSDELRRRFFAQRLELWPARTGWTYLRDAFRGSLLILMAAVGVVLLIACANIAGLQLARAAARQREFSVRSALGAGRLRLIRQLLTESLLLASFGAVLGLLLAQVGTRVLQSLMQLPVEPTSLNLAPDRRVLVFTIAAALLASLLFGLVPALRLGRLDLTTALKTAARSFSGSAERQRTLQTLVVAQVCLSLILLVGAGLFVRTLWNLKGLDSGFTRENLVLFNIDFAETPDAARLSAFQTELLGRLQSLPGARAASLFNFGFLSGNFWMDDFLADGSVAQAGKDLECSGTHVGPRFFDTFGMSVLAGRGFESVDENSIGATNRVPTTAVINQTLAHRHFGEANPVGRRLYSPQRPEMKFEIVGVVPDAKYRSLRVAAPPTIYLPFFRADAGATFAVRTSTEAQVTMAILAALTRELDRSARIRDVRTMTDVVNASVRQERLIAHLGSFFSLCALALTCLGLYGVLSFAVVQRTHEIGVRMALGAQRHDVLSLVIGKGLKLALAGSCLGLVGAFAVTRLTSRLLYGVTPTDPVTFVGVPLLLILVASIASWLPARRATKVHPMVALRYE